MVKQLIPFEKAVLGRKKEQAVLYVYGWIVQLVQFKSKSLSELLERFFFSHLLYFMNTNLIFFSFTLPVR